MKKANNNYRKNLSFFYQQRSCVTFVKKTYPLHQQRSCVTFVKKILPPFIFVIYFSFAVFASLSRVLGMKHVNENSPSHKTP